MEFNGHAIILTVIECLLKQGGRPGKTHVQKALSLLNDSSATDVPFEFVLYKHGPYSFDVEEALEEMQSYGAITIEPNISGYGVTLRPSAMAPFVHKTAPLSRKAEHAIDGVCSFVKTKNVNELEQLATASWIRTKWGKKDREEVARTLHGLKPHISIPTAEHADAEVSGWLASMHPRK